MYLVESIRIVLHDHICRLRFWAHLGGVPGSAMGNGFWMSSRAEVAFERFPEGWNSRGSFAVQGTHPHTANARSVHASRPEPFMPPLDLRGSGKSARCADQCAMQTRHATFDPMGPKRGWRYRLDRDYGKGIIGSQFDEVSGQSIPEKSRTALSMVSFSLMTSDRRAQVVVHSRTARLDGETPRACPDKFSAGS